MSLKGSNMNASLKESPVAAELQAVLNNQRHAFQSEGPVALATRIDRIDRCIALLVDNKEVICEAVNKDFGGRSKYVTLMTDIMARFPAPSTSASGLKIIFTGTFHGVMMPITPLG